MATSVSFLRDGRASRGTVARQRVSGFHRRRAAPGYGSAPAPAEPDGRSWRLGSGVRTAAAGDESEVDVTSTGQPHGRAGHCSGHDGPPADDGSHGAECAYRGRDVLGRVFIWDTPPQREGCRAASQSFALHLVTGLNTTQGILEVSTVLRADLSWWLLDVRSRPRDHPIGECRGVVRQGTADALSLSALLLRAPSSGGAPPPRSAEPCSHGRLVGPAGPGTRRHRGPTLSTCRTISM